MSMLNGIGTGLQTYAMTGNPTIAALSGLAASFFGGGANTAGNAALGLLNGSDEAFQLGMYAQQIQHQEQMQMQSEVFNEMMDEKSEQMREMNTLRDVQMAQRKADDGITKKFIESITE